MLALGPWDGRARNAKGARMLTNEDALRPVNADEGNTSRARVTVPAWFGAEVAAYLDHVETGRPIRAIAREAGAHASTVLRSIRRFESRRDDPLVDEALEALAPSRRVEPDAGRSAPAVVLDRARVEGEARTILPLLLPQGAVLAVAEDLDRAVVVREGVDGRPDRHGVVERAMARAFALKGWIGCEGPVGRVARYGLTTAGRSALRALCGEEVYGMAEAPAAFAARDAVEVRAGGDSPLTMLNRRRDRDGRPFLDPAQIAAGERLLEDFEAAGLPRHDLGEALAAARRAGGAIGAAIDDLGEGLAEIAVRTCCFGEGLEQSEKRMGWAARSGKVVLRIALQRLVRHYGGQDGGGLIG